MRHNEMDMSQLGGCAAHSLFFDKPETKQAGERHVIVQQRKIN
jgi:hypothetical protein